MGVPDNAENVAEKREIEEVEESAAKRARTEEEEADDDEVPELTEAQEECEESEEDDEDDEDDDEDFAIDCLDDIEAEDEDFTLEDFNNEINEEQLEIFNKAYFDFLNELQEDIPEGEEVLLLKRPQQLRPVPQTKEEFKAGMPVAIIPPEMMNYRVELDEAVRSVEYPSDEEGDEEAELEKEAAGQAVDDEAIYQMLSKKLPGLTGVFKENIEMLAKELEENKLEHLWFRALILTDCFFDEQSHVLLALPSGKDMVNELLASLGKLWQGLTAKSDDELSIKEGVREKTMGKLERCLEDLHSGFFSNDATHEKAEFVFQ